MKVASKNKIVNFSRRHADARQPLAAWLAEVEDAEWLSPQDIKRRYISVSIINDRRLVFNIKGNKYRIDVKISYKSQTIFIKRIGTHAQYNKWNF